MKLHAQKLALAAAGSVGICFAICAALMCMWPAPTLQLTAHMLHLTSLQIIEPYFQVTLFNFTCGLVQWMVYTYLCVLLFASLYNRSL